MTPAIAVLVACFKLSKAAARESMPYFRVAREAFGTHTLSRGPVSEKCKRRDKLKLMAIPNVKRFRPFCPSCNDSFTVMAVLPKDANVDAYLTDVVARHDHKAFQESKLQHFKIRVGQQKQKKAK